MKGDTLFMYEAGAAASARHPTRLSNHIWQRLISIAMLAIAVTVSTLAPRWARQIPTVSESLSTLPPVMLWAWERPERLDFIDPRAVGVAFLAQTLHLSGPDVVIRPRLQPLRVPPGTTLMAVVRIDVDRLHPPLLSLQQREAAAVAIADRRELPEIAALQIDFDAAVSQRSFYRGLLHDVRRHMPSDLPLSMTALASWCTHDEWLEGLPVDEVVPMVFRMGADEDRVRRYLNEGDFRVAHCRQSLGVSTDEPLPNRRALRRLYLFHPQSWSSDALTRILEEIGPWP